MPLYIITLSRYYQERECAGVTNVDARVVMTASEWEACVLEVGALNIGDLCTSEITRVADVVGAIAVGATSTVASAPARRSARSAPVRARRYTYEEVRWVQGHAHACFLYGPICARFLMRLLRSFSRRCVYYVC